MRTRSMFAQSSRSIRRPASIGEEAHIRLRQCVDIFCKQLVLRLCSTAVERRCDLLRQQSVVRGACIAGTRGGRAAPTANSDIAAQLGEPRATTTAGTAARACRCAAGISVHGVHACTVPSVHRTPAVHLGRVSPLSPHPI